MVGTMFAIIGRPFALLPRAGELGVYIVLMRSTTLFAALIGLVACGGGGDGYRNPTNPGPNPTPSNSNAINVRDNSFSPNATVLAVGTTVTWTWTGAANHDVTFNDGQGSNTQSTGTYQRTFNAAGAYPYHCTQHAGMTGSVTIQ